MKRRITLSIALVVSVVLLSLMSSDSTVQAQPPGRFTADTGIVSLGANQILRLVVDPRNNDVVYFRRMGYAEGICNSAGVCSHAVSSQTTAIWINQEEIPSGIASFDITGTGNWGVRGIVTSNRRMVVNAQIIDVETGNVDAIIAILIS